MNTTTNLMMLVRREVWENRSLWIAPLVVCGVILLVSAFGGIHVGHGNEFWVGWNSEPPHLNHVDVDPQKLEKIYAGTLIGFAVVQLMTLGIVVFFYLLDSLLAERKDRSILFWKSLPISDTEVVSSKLITALVLAPIYVLVTTAFTQIAFAAIWSLRGPQGLPGELLIPWDGSVWMQVQLAFVALVPAVVVWFLPLAGYLLLVSVWARKNAFLWAVLPPAGILLVENLLMDSHRFAEFLGRRFVGVFQVMDFHGPDSDGETLGVFVQHVGRVFANYETWLGVLVAGAFIVAVIRIRRYRDDS
jgi:hypothetical protein